MVTKCFPFGSDGASLTKPYVQLLNNLLNRTSSVILAQPFPHVSEALQRLITRLLDPDPGRRMTLREIEADPWYNQAIDEIQCANEITQRIS